MKLFYVGRIGYQCWGSACTNSTGQPVSLDTCTSIIQLYVCVCYNSAIVSRMVANETQMDKMINQLIKTEVKLYDMKVLCQLFSYFTDKCNRTLDFSTFWAHCVFALADLSPLHKVNWINMTIATQSIVAFLQIAYLKSLSCVTERYILVTPAHNKRILSHTL